MGVPAYDDAWAPWHDPQVENLRRALPAVHAGLSGYDRPPVNWRGVAVYCEWEMDQQRWRELGERFLAVPAQPGR